MAWGHRKGRGMETQCLRKTQGLRDQKSHKTDKLWMMTLNWLVRNCIRQNPETNQKWTGQCWQRYKLLWFSLFWDNFPPLSLHAESFVLLLSEIKLCLCECLHVHGFYSLVSWTRAWIHVSGLAWNQHRIKTRQNSTSWSLQWTSTAETNDCFTPHNRHLH